MPHRGLERAAFDAATWGVDVDKAMHKGTLAQEQPGTLVPVRFQQHKLGMLLQAQQVDGTHPSRPRPVRRNLAFHGRDEVKVSPLDSLRRLCKVPAHCPTPTLADSSACPVR